MKKKKIIDGKTAEGKKSLGRLPSAPAGFSFKDKSKYSRKRKHKNIGN